MSSGWIAYIVVGILITIAVVVVPVYRANKRANAQVERIIAAKARKKAEDEALEKWASPYRAAGYNDVGANLLGMMARNREEDRQEVARQMAEQHDGQGIRIMANGKSAEDAYVHVYDAEEDFALCMNPWGSRGHLVIERTTDAVDCPRCDWEVRRSGARR